MVKVSLRDYILDYIYMVLGSCAQNIIFDSKELVKWKYFCGIYWKIEFLTEFQGQVINLTKQTFHVITGREDMAKQGQ